ncbi:MAG: CDP-diacylglycerol--serine O-phosphatidyltransferase [Gammaproteobacteria bacterium]|nr:CDP-diacylglycerol--serine O-phosphatidyltransferase [Gammaproteobacteria bacterium]
MSDTSEPAQNPTKPNLRKGIFLLPNLFTTGALFAGFYAIIAAIKGNYDVAAIAVLLAMLLDGLDGRVARLTNTQSAFGAEYDSLSDMVSFGLAPALVVYQWSLAHLATAGAAWGKIGWLAAFIYTASAALRLARFNTQIGIADKRYFQGMPSPAAAAVTVGAVWFCEHYGIEGSDVMIPATLLTVTAGLLMVSRFSYYSFKDLDLKKRVPFVAVLIVLMAFVLVSIETSTVLFIMFFLYMISAPIIALFRWIRKRRKNALAKTET